MKWLELVRLSKRHRVLVFGLAGLCVLAAILLAWVRAGGTSYQGHSVKFWVQELAAPEPRRREAATEAFRALGTKAVPILSQLLRRFDGPVHQSAWDLAGKLPTPLGQVVRRAVGPLDATATRVSAARALRFLGPKAEAAVPALSQALEDPDMRVRYEAAQALGQVGPAGIRPLVLALQAPGWHERYCAVSGLRCVPPAAPQVAPALFQALADTNTTVSSWAGQSLTGLGTNAAPFLTHLMVQGDAPTRQHAAKALGSLRYRAWVVPPLVRMLQDPEPACRAVAVETLAQLGMPDRAMLSAYLGALKDPEARVRAGAVQGLGAARSQIPVVLPALTAALEDESPVVREAAARSLGQLGRRAEPAATNLTRLLADHEEAVRTAARTALDKLK